MAKDLKKDEQIAKLIQMQKEQNLKREEDRKEFTKKEQALLDKHNEMTKKAKQRDEEFKRMMAEAEEQNRKQLEA